MLTIVKPVLEKSSTDVSIADVLAERFIHELKFDGNAEEEAKYMANIFKQSGTELPRCRLKATLKHMGVKIAEGWTCDISDSGDKVYVNIYSIYKYPPTVGPKNIPDVHCENLIFQKLCYQMLI